MGFNRMTQSRAKRAKCAKNNHFSLINGGFVKRAKSVLNLC